MPALLPAAKRWRTAPSVRPYSCIEGLSSLSLPILPYPKPAALTEPPGNRSHHPTHHSLTAHYRFLLTPVHTREIRRCFNLENLCSREPIVGRSRLKEANTPSRGDLDSGCLYQSFNRRRVFRLRKDLSLNRNLRTVFNLRFEERFKLINDINKVIYGCF